MKKYIVLAGLAIVVLCCFKQGFAQNLECWNCVSHRPGNNTQCETGRGSGNNKNYGPKTGGCDFCRKLMLRRKNGNEQVQFIQRDCYNERRKTEDFAPLNDCTRQDVRNGRWYECFCDRANCNHAGVVILSKGLAGLATLVLFLKHIF